MKRQNPIEILGNNRTEVAKLSRKYPHCSGDIYGFTVSENSIWIRHPVDGRSISLFEDECVKELEKYIKEYLN